MGGITGQTAQILKANESVKPTFHCSEKNTDAVFAILCLFFSDTDHDECDVSNGGCSHKCVNTARGYKCECPDPKLSLSSDNRTCHGDG